MTRLQFHHWENSAMNTHIPMSGPAVKNHGSPNRGRTFYAQRNISYLLLSVDCRQILVRVHPLHRHRRTRQVHLQVQHQSEVANPHQETGAIHKKTHTQKKEKDIKRASDDRSRDLPESLEEFTENLEVTEVPAPAHISNDSDSERPRKVALKKLKFTLVVDNDRQCTMYIHTQLPTVPQSRSSAVSVPIIRH